MRVGPASARLQVFLLSRQQLGAVDGEQNLVLRHFRADIIGLEIADVAVEFQCDLRQQAFIERDLANRTDRFDQVTVGRLTRFQTDHLTTTVIDGDRNCVVHHHRGAADRGRPGGDRQALTIGRPIKLQARVAANRIFDLHRQRPLATHGQVHRAFILPGPGLFEIAWRSHRRHCAHCRHLRECVDVSIVNRPAIGVAQFDHDLVVANPRRTRIDVHSNFQIACLITRHVVLCSYGRVACARSRQEKVGTATDDEQGDGSADPQKRSKSVHGCSPDSRDRDALIGSPAQRSSWARRRT